MEGDGKSFEAFGEDDTGICQFKNGRICGANITFSKQASVLHINVYVKLEGILINRRELLFKKRSQIFYYRKTHT